MSEQPSDSTGMPPLDLSDLQGSAAAVSGPSVPPLSVAEVEASTVELLEQLRQDRLWLLRQLDSGRWSEWRLDLAALERELGQLLDQIDDRRGVA